MSHRTLLLNNAMEPLGFVSAERAFVLVIKERVDVLNEWPGASFASTHATHGVPATIALKRYVPKRWKAARFNRTTLFNRDGWVCQYCRAELTAVTAEIDHVVPSSRGGRTSWTNCVASCRKCNKSKRNRTPAEAGMTLIAQPKEPKLVHYLDRTSVTWHAAWNTFLP